MHNKLLNFHKKQYFWKSDYVGHNSKRVIFCLNKYIQLFCLNDKFFKKNKFDQIFVLGPHLLRKVANVKKNPLH